VHLVASASRSSSLACKPPQATRHTLPAILSRLLSTPTPKSCRDSLATTASRVHHNASSFAPPACPAAFNRYIKSRVSDEADSALQKVFRPAAVLSSTGRPPWYVHELNFESCQPLIVSPQVLWKRKPVQFLPVPEIDNDNEEVCALSKYLFVGVSGRLILVALGLAYCPDRGDLHDI
jgi:hypothetical protein